MPFPDTGPIQLPDGRWACEEHHLQICGTCCCDYTVFDELSDNDADNDNWTNGSANDDGRYPTLFEPPPGATTADVFIPSSINGQMAYVNPDDRSCCLVYTDGACLDNGLPGARGGCGIVFGPSLSDTKSSARFRLEDQGPDGEIYPPTSNRAELRAVIAVMQSLCRQPAGRNTVVIAADSEYVVKGATEHLRTWVPRKWRTSLGKPVKNKDLWALLLELYGHLQRDGCEVKFWRIGREENSEADALAKRGAAQAPVVGWTGHAMFV
jgi:ribonuclease HI